MMTTISDSRCEHKNSVVVLAGGLGTRLRSVLPDKPKCLAPIGEKSFLEIQCQSLADNGFNDIVLSLGYMSELVEQAVKNFGHLRSIIRCVVETHSLGTGGGIMNAMRQAGLLQAVVVNGDTYFDGDISALHAPLRETELCRMGIVQIDDRSRYGGIDMGTEDSGIVRGFIEKGTSGPGWINAGHYRLNMQCFANVGTDQKFSFEEEILPTLVSRHNATYTKLQGKLIDIGIPSAYQYFCSLQEGTSTSN